MKTHIYKFGSRLKQGILALALVVCTATVFAQATYTFNYTGTVQTQAFLPGTYNIQMWGADGGNSNNSRAGIGGYSGGTLTLTSPTTLYIVVGGSPIYQTAGGLQPGGYNGGGSGFAAATGRAGGGATHIASANGLLSALSTNTAAVIIVAAGGGGDQNSGLIGHGGGLTGGGTYGGTQSSSPGGVSGGFGQGGNITTSYGGGGGGGWYGGGGNQNNAGSGGSGYIGGVSNGVTSMSATAGFVTKPSTALDGLVIITELCNMSLYAANSTNSLNPTICAGQSLTLTTNAISNYSWSTGASTSSLVVSPSTSSVYVLTANAPSNCTAARTISVTVSSGLPVLSISNPSNTICLGKTATLTASGALSYTWANAGVVNGQTFTPASTANYTVTGANGCGTSTAVTSITVAPLAVTASASSSLICQGYTATLTAVSSINSYTWQPGGQTGASAVVSPTSATIYTVTASDGICFGTQTVSLLTKTTPTITASASATLVCPGDQVVLSATGGTSYVWTPGNLSGSSVTVSPSTSTLYVVAGTNTANCTSSGNQVVVVIAPPTVSITSNKIATCSGAEVVLTASGANTYVWTGGPSTTVYSVSPVSATVYTVTGTQNNNPCPDTETISVTVVVPNVTASSNTAICIGGTVQLSASGANSYAWNGTPGANLIVSPAVTSVYTLVAQTNSASIICPTTRTVQISINPNPTITVTSLRNVICKGETNTLTATGAASFVWQGTLGITSTVVVKPASTTIYTLTGTSAAGCTSDAQITTIVSSCNGIDENVQANTISVYPNPSNGVFTVRAASAMTLNLVSTLGQVIRTLELTTENGYSIEVSGLAKGVYYLNTGNGKEYTSYSKLIVN